MKYVDMMKIKLGRDRVVIEALCEGGTVELKPKFRRSWSYKGHGTSVSGKEKNHCKELEGELSQDAETT